MPQAKINDVNGDYPRRLRKPLPEAVDIAEKILRIKSRRGGACLEAAWTLKDAWEGHTDAGANSLFITRDRTGVSACRQKRRRVNGMFVSDGKVAFGLEYMYEAGFLPKLKMGQQVEVRIMRVRKQK